MSVVQAKGGDSSEQIDHLVTEEPLAIRITFGPLRDRRRTTVSVTMRTPGHDADLALGFLFAEGVVKDRAQVLDVALGKSGNDVRVDLHPDLSVDLSRLDRRGFTTSACGVCGKTAIEAVEIACDGPRPGGTPIAPAVIHRLPEMLRAAQPAFASTGGLHAAALFDRDGSLLSVREDVGRHNAVDKLIGAEVRAGHAPLHEHILLVSGRAGFELVQKAAVAAVPVFAAIGAPTTLAVELAHRLGVTLLGFVRGGRFNIYAGPERIAL